MWICGQTIWRQAGNFLRKQKIIRKITYYEPGFTLELETALATDIDQASGILSTQIVRNPAVPSVVHSDFDNFDQFIN